MKGTKKVQSSSVIQEESATLWGREHSEIPPMEQELVQAPQGREVGRAHLSRGWKIGKVGTAKAVKGGQAPGQLYPR